MASGGKREGAGRRFGSKNLSTIAQEEAREFVRTYITGRLQPLLDAQIDNAQGLQHLMMRDPKTGKFERITGDAKQVDKALKSKNAFWIYTKDPNVQAFTDLMNRALDKPAEHVQVAGADGGPLSYDDNSIMNPPHWSPTPTLSISKPMIPTTNNLGFEIAGPDRRQRHHKKQPTTRAPLPSSRGQLE
jgi:hypothetical protein